MRTGTSPRQHRIQPVGVLGLLIVVSIVVLALFSYEKKPPTVPGKLQTARLIEPSVTGPIFKDRTPFSGLRFMHNQGGKTLTSLDETLGAGVCVFDYDQDGWDDILLVNGSGQTRFYGQKEWWANNSGHRLFKNLGDFHFRDVTVETGLESNGWGMGCLTDDFDADGDVDLLITQKGRNRLFENINGESFKDQTLVSGLTDEAWSISAISEDFNHDGLIDIYVSNYLSLNKGNRKGTNVAGKASGLSSEFIPQIHAGSANHLYLNQGHWRYQESARALGAADPAGRTLMALYTDMNRDGRNDLLLLNDSGSPDRIYASDTGKRFKDIAPTLGLADINESSAATTLALGESFGQTLSINSQSGTANRLLQTNQTLTYRDQARSNGLAADRWSTLWGQGIIARDFDLDGDDDLITVNGPPHPSLDHPRLPQGQPSLFWRNNGNRNFEPEPVSQEGYEAIWSQRGLVTADFDNDGDLDLIISANNGPARIYENLSKSPLPWVRVETIGLSPEINYLEASAPLAFPQHQTLMGNGTRAIILRMGAGNSRTLIANGQAVVMEPGQIVRHSAKGWRIIDPKRTKHENENRFDKAIKAILETGDAKEKQQLIGLEPSLDVLMTTSTDQSPEVRAFALNQLARQESEFAADYLLRGLEDTSTQVRCATAHSFERLFIEEEAMVLRKHLAVSKLIRLLSIKDQKTRQCALSSLAASDDYRAAQPIASLLHTEDRSTRAHAAKALGEIRDPAILASIQGALDTETDIEVVIELIRALKRLQPDYRATDWLASTQNEQLRVNIPIIVKRLLSSTNKSPLFKDHELSNVLGGWALNCIHLRNCNQQNLAAWLQLYPRLQPKVEQTAFLNFLADSSNQDLFAFALAIFNAKGTHKQYKPLTQYQGVLYIKGHLPIESLPAPIPDDLAPWAYTLASSDNSKLLRHVCHLLANSKDIHIQQTVVRGLLKSRSLQCLQQVTESLSINDINPRLKNSLIKYLITAAPRARHVSLPHWFNDLLMTCDRNAHRTLISWMARHPLHWSQDLLSKLLRDRKAPLTTRKTILNALHHRGDRKQLTEIARRWNDPLSIEAILMLDTQNPKVRKQLKRMLTIEALPPLNTIAILKTLGPTAGEIEKSSQASQVQGGRNAAAETHPKDNQADRQGSEYRPTQTGQQPGHAGGLSRCPPITSSQS